MASSVLPQQGVLRVVSNSALDEHTRQQNAAHVAAQKPADAIPEGLAAHILAQFEIFSNHRNSNDGWGERLLSALRAFNGQYDAAKLTEIKKFGGSEVYARVVAMKCRSASALLRDVYLAPDRPWGLEPPADPDVPPNIVESIQRLVQVELSTIDTLGGGGQEVNTDSIRDRVMQLMQAAREAAKKNAKKQAEIAEDKIDEILTEGGFYKALADFLVELPLFPFACIKGPVVRILPTVDWETGSAVIKQTPRLTWQRVSPFDLYWTPGASEIEDADVIERTRYTRADLNDLLDLPGYRHEEILAVLDEYGRGGLHDNWDMTDSERASQESRENPMTNRSGLIACLEYHGSVQGRMLVDLGVDASKVPEPLRDYMIQAWLIGRHIIKVQLSPSPRKRHPYFITSFEKVPGTPIGNGIPDTIGDIADVCNATLRALVNNQSIASGPQVVINSDRLSADEDAESLFPWKRWHTTSDPMGNNAQVPVSFFQPVSNAQELLTIYKEFSAIADEVSGIPRYLSGGQAGGGAGRTAAGMAMLMGNASKILQTVAANVDRDIVDNALMGLFDMLMLTDTSGLLTGQESIKVMGVNVAIQRETQRSRQLEFLTATANPIDAKIVGPKGRAVVLREVAQGIGIPGDEIVPSEDDLERMHQEEQALQQQAMAAAGAEAQGGKRGKTSTNDIGPRVRIAGGAG